jgi:dockerin type I repeat protein
MRPSTFAMRHWSGAGLVLIFTLVTTAQAVVISATDTRVNHVAPANDPGWNNVAHLSTASAVYLGNRWVITANHVPDAPVGFSDGRIFNISVGSDVQLVNTGLNASLGAADLRMFRLAADPGLPALQIDTASPTAGSAVMMIGAGRDRGPDMLGWHVSSLAADAVWTQLPLPLVNRIGFPVLQTSHMEWGTNQVQTGGVAVTNGSTLTFATQFISSNNGFQAQAEVGDSGGGVFRLVNGSWKLVGIMDAVQLLGNQPSNTAVFGDQTFSVDLASYRDQIEAVLNKADAPWQNQVNRFDVDRSGTVTPLDALRLINELQKSGSHTLTGAPTASDLFLDVNGDGGVGTLDLVQLINALIAGTANPSASPQSTALFVPEPSGGTLAALGLLAIALARGTAMVWRRRRAV